MGMLMAAKVDNCFSVSDGCGVGLHPGIADAAPSIEMGGAPEERATLVDATLHRSGSGALSFRTRPCSRARPASGRRARSFPMGACYFPNHDTGRAPSCQAREDLMRFL
jgi:hypothetical protein